MIKSIVVVGGGAAGWITAGLLAARYVKGGPSPVSVTLIESPSIGIIGVGEGTWPTMVDTLKKLGISEEEFIRKCDASFKQASKFQRWVTEADDDTYYHPFSKPQGFDQISLVTRWQETQKHIPFAKAVGIQADLCDQKLAPKQTRSPEYASAENHGYHLDAGKFAKLLTEHCTTKLGVQHIQADVVKVNSAENGDIASLSTEQAGNIEGDLFIDCSGMAALLIGKHYQVPFICKKDILFIDKALAVQVPYKDPNADIESATLSTAQRAGWIWDIGLPSRRGVGYVYASKYTTKKQAEHDLRDYLRADVSDVDGLKFRELDIRPGHREKFWVNNCVAVGMSSGFLEPLEASALVMVEMAANTISLQLPASREAMDVVAKNYNEIFTFRWNRIIDFLKLHYVLSKREDNAFWLDNRKAETIPESLKDLLTLWKHQPPSNNGFLSPHDLFPAASYQYILYGMGFETAVCHLDQSPGRPKLADENLHKVVERRQKIPALLPSNRELLTHIRNKENSTTPDDQIHAGAFLPVSLQDLKNTSKKAPVFFKQHKDNKRFYPVALLGFMPNENLTTMRPHTGNGNTRETDESHIQELARMNLLEPVKLDIIFNDDSRTLISDLYVINRENLTRLADNSINSVMQNNLMPVINDTIKSLEHIPMLIEKKNKLIADHRANNKRRTA